MYIAKNNNLIILAKNTKEELIEALGSHCVYDTIEYTQEDYQLLSGVWLTAKEAEAQEQERINKLSLTAADVERAIYKAKGIDFDDIVELVKDNPEIDVKALKIELKANKFYRRNPYINQIGKLLGFSERQLNEFFETNDYTKLLPNWREMRGILSETSDEALETSSNPPVNLENKGKEE